MTREYALNNFEMFIEISEDIEEAQMRDISNFIRKIYDDFANRTCENCKYWGYFDSDVLFETCNFGNIEHSYRADSFSCNRWESKNESLDGGSQ